MDTEEGAEVKTIINVNNLLSGMLVTTQLGILQYTCDDTETNEFKKELYISTFCNQPAKNWTFPRCRNKWFESYDEVYDTNQSDYFYQNKYKEIIR